MIKAILVFLLMLNIYMFIYAVLKGKKTESRWSGAGVIVSIIVLILEFLDIGLF